MLSSCIIAFSLYSVFPMPPVEWTREHLRYVLCFLPWVGIPVGVLEVLAFLLLQEGRMGGTFSSCILTALPILLSGGIHMDGLMDTADAVGSRGDIRKRQDILKDTHTGAFAVLACGLYLLTLTGIWSEVTASSLLAAVCCFPYSRCLSGLCVATLPCAREDGLACTLCAAAPGRVRWILVVETVLTGAVMCLLNGRLGAAMAAGGLVLFLWYARFARRSFGGMSGDLAGCFLQLCEWTQLFVLVVLQRLIS